MLWGSVENLGGCYQPSPDVAIQKFSENPSPKNVSSSYDPPSSFCSPMTALKSSQDSASFWNSRAPSAVAVLDPIQARNWYASAWNLLARFRNCFDCEQAGVDGIRSLALVLGLATVTGVDRMIAL